MELTKFLKVLIDISDEEKALKISDLLDNLLSNIRGQHANIGETLKKIEESLNTSIFNDYTTSNFNILDEIEGTKFYGKTALKHLNGILLSGTYDTPKVIKELSDYITERKAFIKNIELISENLKSLKFEPHYYDDIYEIGILLPKEITKNEIPEIIKHLNKWNFIFRNLNEINGLPVKDAEISLLNNGSIEFYFIYSVKIAVVLGFIIDRTLTLYKKILEIRKLEIETKKLEIDVKDAYIKKETKIIKSTIKEIVNEILEESKELIKERKNELEIGLTLCVEYIAKSLDKGIVIEIKPPEIKKPEILEESETPSTKEERKKAEKLYNEQTEMAKSIKENANQIRKIIGKPKNVFKYLEEPKEKENNKKS